MLSAIASVSGEALTDEYSAEWGPGIVELFDAIVSPRLDLPCQVSKADLWFADAPQDLERAKELCSLCPVRSECLAGALARREPWGVWGGEIVERGLVIGAKRSRGRPRKVVEPVDKEQESSVCATTAA